MKVQMFHRLRKASHYQRLRLILLTAAVMNLTTKANPEIIADQFDYSKIEQLDKLTESELYVIYTKDMKESLAELDQLTPPIPAVPKVEPENPPPYKMKRITFGSLLGKKPAGKDDK